MKFDTILADPPSSYASRSPWNKTRFGGGVHGKYFIMTDNELLEMGELVKQISAENAILFLWATCPNLPIAIKVVEAWGFRYCTVGFTWVKTNPRARKFLAAMTQLFFDWYRRGRKPSLNEVVETINNGLLFPGPGHYTAANIELCLIGAKGKVDVNSLGAHQVILSPINKKIHSRKPAEIRDRIENLCNGTRRIELFCTEPEIRNQGWLPVGNQIDGKDIRDALREIINIEER